MLDHWLLPVEDDQLIQLVREQPDSLGRRLLQSRDDSENIRVAIIGSQSSWLLPLRQHLYRMAAPFALQGIADLGNLRRTDPEFILPLLRELHASRIIPILILPEVELLYSLFRGQSASTKHLHLCMIAAELETQLQETTLTGPYAQLLQHPELAHFSWIGGQGHFLPSAFQKWLQQQHYEQLRLGAARKHLPQAEPLIRDADILAFHINSLKQIEAPAQQPASPSGFFSEEACQLIRYAGMSDKLKALGILGYTPDTDTDAYQSAAVLAQVIWYFLDGLDNRMGDFPVSKKNLVQYVVQNKEWQTPMTFWKSNKSGRWWLQIPEAKGSKGRHHLLPCTYEEYASCTKDEIPDRLMYLLQRENG